MYNRLTGLGQTGHDNMWDTGVARQAKGRAKSILYETNGPKEYMDTHEKRQALGVFGPELSYSDWALY